MQLEKFIEKLKQTYSNNLKSIVLFGSAVDQPSPPKHNIDLMLVFDSVRLDQLTAGSRLIQRWMRKGNPEPLLIDKEHIAKSLDVFPLEFADMKDRHRVLWGENPLDNIVIDPKDLRHQCEREIKEKLLLLRERAIALHPKHRALARLLTESLSAALTLVRGTLRLVGDPVPPNQEEQLTQLSTKSGVNVSPLTEVLRAHRKGKRISGDRVIPLLDLYLTSLEDLATYIDSLEEVSST